MPQDLPSPQPEMPAGLLSPSYVDPLRIVWRRKALVALGIASAFVVGSLYYVRTKPVYRSEAQVLVVKKRPDAVTGEAARLSHFEDYVTTHRILITSPLIVARAVERSNLGSLQSFAGEEGDLTEAIIQKLTTARVSKDTMGANNSVLKLQFQGPVAGECGTVVNAVLDSYKSFLDETYRNLTDDTVKLITEARDVLNNDLAKKEAAYREFREKSPLIWKGTEEVNPRQDRLAMIESQRIALLLRRADLEEQLATIAKAQESGRSPDELVALVSDLAAKSTDLTVRTEGKSERSASATLKDQLLPLLLEEQTLLETLGPNHPQVVSVREKIETIRNFFALPSAAYSRAAEATGNQQRAPSSQLVAMYVAYLNQELDRVKISAESRSELYQREHAAARELNGYEIRDAEFRSDISRTQALYDGLVKRLQEASLMKDYGGFDARVIAPAGIGKKTHPSGLMTLAGTLFSGFLGSLGLVYLAEITDKSFRTPEEIRRRLGWPVIGHIPLFKLDEQARALTAWNGKLDPMLFAHYKPRSAGAEAYRAVRTALYFSGAGEQHKVLQITSPNPGDGKSTLAANVAVSMAQSGKRTLLIDADLRNPRQHRIFNVSRQMGLASVIAHEAEVVDAIQPSTIGNLWILPCGPIPPDPAELLTSPRFSELLALLRDQYDYVLIDTSPLLTVTDASVVAARVDGVLLTLRISKNGRSQAERAKEILGTMNARLLGVVVNGIDARAAGGYEYQYYSYDSAGGYRPHDGETQDEPANEEPATNLAPR